MPADNPTCATCRWWETESSCPGAFGECRRHSPLRSEDREGVRAYPYPVWPPTSSQDWCGEHAPRVAEPRCWLHPDRITDGNLLFGRHLCGDCWMEWMVAEQEGATPAFRAKFFKATPKATPKDTPDAPR